MLTRLAHSLFSLLLVSSFCMADNLQERTNSLVESKKIVVFDLGALDSLDQLGSPVKGVPKQNLPTYLAKYRTDHYVDVGGLKTPNIEKIKSIKPDVIIISGRQNEYAKELASIASTVTLSVDPKNYEASFKHNMQELGKIVNKDVTDKLAGIDKQVALMQQQVNQATYQALILVHYNGKFIASDSSNYAGLIHGWLGIKGVNLDVIEKDNSNPRLLLSTKDITRLNPDIIFIIDRNEAIGEGKIDKQVVDSTMNQTNAYQRNKVIYLTPDLWYLSGNGLESISLQLGEVAKAFK